MNSEKKGEIFILSGALLWSLFPILTVLSLSKVSPLFSLAVTTFFSFLFFLGVVAYRKKWNELKNTSALKDILLTTLFIGILFYTLYFFGLKFTTAGNAGLISPMQIFFSFLVFNIFRGEYISKGHITGALLMTFAVFIVLLPDITSGFSLNIGDVFILVAVALAPIGNFFQRRAREQVSSETILFLRSLLTFPAVLILAILFGETIDFGSLTEALPFIVISGVFLFGLSKLFWVEGIHRIAVVKANALGSFKPLLTLLFAFLFLKEIPTVFQLISLIPLLVGLFLITRQVTPQEVT